MLQLAWEIVIGLLLSRIVCRDGAGPSSGAGARIGTETSSSSGSGTGSSFVAHARAS